MGEYELHSEKRKDTPADMSKDQKRPFTSCEKRKELKGGRSEHVETDVSLVRSAVGMTR
jgi:hypothetical protein